MSTTEDGQEAKKDAKTVDPKPCNVCGTETTQRCSVCRIRRYCSRECQKQDWKQHKRYCRRPPTDEQRLEAVAEVCQDDLGISMEQLYARVDDPSNVDAVEKAMNDMIREVMTANGIDSPPEGPLFPPEWSIDQAAVWEELQALPPSPGGESFVFSFMTQGHMDDETGQLIYFLNCMAELTDKVRVMDRVSHRPGRKDLDETLYKALAKPKRHGGEPQRPSHILFAHRWGEDMVRPLISLLRDKLGIHARLESRPEALASARRYGTDADGYNFPDV